MGRGIHTSSLTKSYILEKVSQITIFAEYLNISDILIKHCINTGELICSPIRDDCHPTVGFKYDNRGRLKMRDFAGFFWGDCFDIVALVISNLYKKEFNVSNKQDFNHILRHITITFKDIFYNQEKDPNLKLELKESVEGLRKKKANIEIVVRQWNIYDRMYWDKFGVSIQYLNTNFIYAVDQYYIDRKVNPQPKYYYNIDDLCYAYLLGKDNKSNCNHIKLYFPNREHGTTRFITNCNHLEGIYNLEKNNYDIIVITKSTKDRLSIGANLMTTISLYREAQNINIGVINIPHETYKLRELEYKWLEAKLSERGKIVSLMDNDRVGKFEAKYLRSHYGIIPLLINRNKYNAKDFAELRSNNSVEEVHKLLINSINYIMNYGQENDKSIRDKKKSSSIPF